LQNIHGSHYYQAQLFQHTVSPPVYNVVHSRHRLSYDDCLEDKTEKLLEKNCSVLCCVRQHVSCVCDTHTHEQFFKMSVGLGLGLFFPVFV